MATIKTYRTTGPLGYDDVDDNFDNLNSDKIERVVSVNDSSAGINITQTGTGASIVVNTDEFVVDNSGNIGIGTDSPQVSLDVSSRTDGISIPSGTTEQRPDAIGPTIRHNTTIGSAEYYNGSTWGALASGIPNVEVFATPGTFTFTVPAGVTRIKVTVVGAGGGVSTGGTSSFGSMLSATGGGAQISGVYGSTTNLAVGFNIAGVGVGGDINLYGQVGTDSANVNLSGVTQTRLANATGGMTALGFGRGSNIAASETVAANSRIVARGGAGGGAAISILTLTSGSTHVIVVGAGGGNGAVDGRVIIEY